MKNIYLQITSLVIAGLFIVLAFGSSDVDSEDDDNTSEEISSSNIAMFSLAQFDSTIIYLDSMLDSDRKELEAIDKEMVKLKKNFKLKEDEFTGNGWYKHNYWGHYYWPNWKTLYVYVGKNGNIFFHSNYFASDWIFHTYVQVKVGEEKITSASVETYEDNHKTDVSGGNVYEQIYYSSDNGICKAIAENQDEKVLVRFQGDQYYSDATLNSKAKKAISDCYHLSQYLSGTPQKEIDERIFLNEINLEVYKELRDGMAIDTSSI